MRVGMAVLVAVLVGSGGAAGVSVGSGVFVEVGAGVAVGVLVAVEVAVGSWVGVWRGVLQATRTPVSARLTSSKAILSSSRRVREAIDLFIPHDPPDRIPDTLIIRPQPQACNIMSCNL